MKTYSDISFILAIVNMALAVVDFMFYKKISEATYFLLFAIFLLISYGIGEIVEAIKKK